MGLQLQTNNERVNGFSHYVDVGFADLSTGAVSLAATLATAAPGWLVRNASWKVLEEFDGGATSELTLELGYDLTSGVDDPNAFITAKSVHADATAIAYATGDGAAFAQRGGYVFNEAADIELHAVATGGDLDELTAGKVRIFLDLVKLDRLVRTYSAE